MLNVCAVWLAAILRRFGLLQSGKNTFGAALFRLKTTQMSTRKPLITVVILKVM